MAVLGLRQAALAAGVTRQTIYRLARSGKLSTVTRDDGSKGVDTSELARVFGALRDPETVTETSNSVQRYGNGDMTLQGELEATRRALSIAEAALAQAAERETRLLEILDRQTRLLEHKPPQVDPDELEGASKKKLRRMLRRILGG